MAYAGHEDRRRNVDDMHQVAAEAARQAVVEAVPAAIRATLIQMGFDPEHPLKAQQDAQWVRSTRERCEGVGGKALLTVVALIAAGGATFAWNAFTDLLKKQ